MNTINPLNISANPLFNTPESVNNDGAKVGSKDPKIPAAPVNREGTDNQTSVTLPPAETALNAASLEALSHKLRPSASGFSALSTMLAEIIIKSASDERAANRSARLAETESLCENLKNQADKMKNEAQKQYIASMVSSAFQLAGGVISVGLGASSLVISAKAAANLDRAAELMNKAQNMGTIGQGLSGVGTATGSMVGASYQKEAAQIAAERKLDEAQQRAIESRIENLKEINQGLQELIKASLEMVQSITQGMNQSMNRILG